MSWASDKARELVPPDSECGAGDCQCKRARERASVERAIRETLDQAALVAAASEFYATDRDAVQRAAAAIRKLGEP